MKANEIIALMGESGSGKSSLLRLIAGLERVDTGEIWLRDQRLSSERQNITAQQRAISLSFQDAWLFPTKRIRQNIALAIHNLPKAARSARAMKWLSLLNMEQFAERFPHELSGGEQQRIALLRALATAPELMLLDEPFSKLDQGLKVSLRNEVKQLLRETQTSAILVTHDPADVFAITDRVLVMQAGQIVQQGKPQELFERPTSRYTAQLMGEVNIISAQNLGKLGGKGIEREAVYSLRPSEIQIELRDGKGLFRIVEQAFQGDSWRIVCTHQELHLIVYAHQQFPTDRTYYLFANFFYPMSI